MVSEIWIINKVLSLHENHIFHYMKCDIIFDILKEL